MRNLRGGSKLLALPVLLILSIGTLFVISSRSVQMPPHSADGFDLEGPFSVSRLRHLTRVLAETPQDMDSAGRLETPPGYTASTTGARLLFAHIGDGEIPSLKRFMKTTFILVNDSNYPASGEIGFYDDSGTPLRVRINGTTASRFNITLRPRESKRMETSGTGDLKVGWALVLTDQPINGTSSFSMRNSSGKVFSDVGVAESLLNEEFTLFADSIGTADTGVALVNPDPSRRVTLTIELRNITGAIVSTQSLQIPPRGHLARFLTELFKQVPGISEFEGSLRITGDLPFGGITLRTVGTLLTSVPMIPAPSQGQIQSALFFPHVADGSGSGLKIATSIILFNNTDVPVSGMVGFRQSDSTEMPVKIGNQTDDTVSFTLGPRAVRRLVTGGTGGIKTGWAMVGADSHISGAAVFHMFNQSGSTITEVGVEDATPLGITNLVADSIGPFRTGFAVANPLEDEEIEVSFSLFDQNGSLILQKSINLPGYAHRSQFLDELFADVPGIDEMEGLVVVGSDGPLLTTTLRQVGTLTTSVPTLLPSHGFAPVTVLEPIQNLTGTSPSFRLRLQQSGFDLSLDTLRIENPKLGLNPNSIKPGDQIAYGFFILDLGASAQGGIVKAVVTELGSVRFDIVGSGPGISPGTVLLSGQLDGTPSSDFTLELGPTDPPNTDWNSGVGLELDMVFLPDILVAPLKSGPTTFSIRAVSASAKLKERGAGITHTAEQPQTFVTPDASTPNLTGIRPILVSPGGTATVTGTNLKEDTLYLFPGPEGTEVEGAYLEGSGNSIQLWIPDGVIDGVMQAKQGARRGNTLDIGSVFGPQTILKMKGAGGKDFSLVWKLLQPQRQLILQKFETRLFGASLWGGGLQKGVKVGTMAVNGGSSATASNEFDVLVEENSGGTIRLKAVKSGSSTAKWTLTVAKIADSDGISCIVESTASTDLPTINAYPAEIRLELPGLVFSPLTGRTQTTWVVEATSGPSDLSGQETAITVNQSLAVLQ